MLTQPFDKKFLLGSTVIAGFAALTVISGPAHAQSTASDTTAATTAVQQQSPEQGAPPEAAPDPAVVDTPDNPTEARNNQGEPVTDDASEIEAVVVTGSRIRRDPTNAPAPLIQVNREEILQSGQTNLVDFLADVPALQSSFTPTDQTTGGLGIGGLSALNLRNLGTARTLVLIDGRRQVGATLGTLVVDVDTIPSLLIENTEIVTGGQSALYGTDAVAGVVNFILRRNFEGLEVDGALSELNQDGQASGRISALIGKNLLNDRLNVYAFGEYQKDEEVLDLDIDHLREANILLNVDSDPSPGEADNQLDNIAISGARTLSFQRGGTFILANQIRPSTGFIPGTNRIADPDFTVVNCGAVPTLAQRRTTTINTLTCTNINPDNPTTVYTFNADGSARLVNFGTFRDTNGNSRPTTIGGDGQNPNTEFSQGARFPDQENYRFQAGFNFDVTDNIQVFGEAKYVKDETILNSSQSTFFQATFQEIPVNTVGGVTGNSFNTNVYGLDNAFLPANLRTAILNNTRPTFDLNLGTATAPNPNFGNQTGTVADPRGFLQLFGPSRPQSNERELTRYVLGVRGDRDALGFVKNFSYEAAYTYSETEFSNVEQAVDSERFFYATDAVRNAQGQIVCRVQELSSRGIVIPDPIPGGTGAGQVPGRGGNLDPNSDAVRGCTPINFFGSDFRFDANHENATGGGGRPGLTPEQRAYITATVSTQDRNEQTNFLGFVSGEVLDNVLPAGPIGIALGYEYRKEAFGGLGRENNRGARALFLNNSFNNPGAEYSFNELFGEVRVPLLRDLPLADSVEVSAAYRRSESSIETIGEIETYSVQALYRPTRDVLFRATFGEAVRVPTLSDLFNRGFGTFAALTDPCDATVLRNTADPVIRANRRANCVALLGPGYDPDNTQLVYQSTPAGAGGAGNPLLEPEESRSYTLSISLTPRFIPRFSLVLDYYNIQLTNAIQAPAAQTNLNNCFQGTVLNAQACGLFDRNGPTPPGSGQNAQPFGIVFFRGGALNFAAQRAQGIDFNSRYSIDTADFLQRDLGRLDYSIRGTYNIRQENFFNLLDPSDATENDSGIGNPRVRFLSTLTYSPIDRFSVSWDWDFQSSQELADSDLLIQDPDNRLAEFLETGSFSVHDFTARYEVRDGITVRGGVINAFDAEPPLTVAPPGGLGDIFDLFGRRFFVGANLKFGGARN
jgi:outer membrane receptor protein involved in Fe transport